MFFVFFFSSRRRHTRYWRDWSSDVCSSDLSAGRVQSPALRLIVEREREIAAFVPVEYWSVDVRLTPDTEAGNEGSAFVARVVEVPDGKLATAPDKKGVLLGNEADAATHVENL